MDDLISPGTRFWAQKIWKHLKACQAFVVVMTPRSLESHWVDCELIIALEQKKKIFPVLLEDERWFSVANIQHIDVRGGVLPSDSFFSAVGSHLSKSLLSVDDSFPVTPSKASKADYLSGEDSENSEENEFETLVKGLTPEKNLVWAGDWFVNVGEGGTRTWADCEKFGFLSAGQGAVYSNALKRLDIGSTVYAYQSGWGYVGLGKVTQKAVPIKDFVVGQEEIPLLDMDLKAENPGANSDNPELSEWVVGVKWLNTFPKNQAQRFTGAFANQNVVCKLRNKKTLEFLREKFGWAGDWFVNVGDGNERSHRNWEDCREYGFISAGHGARFARAMKKLEVGSTIYAYASGGGTVLRGYVGFGEVVEAAVPIKDFTVGEDDKPLLDMDLRSVGLGHDLDDLELSEWVVRIKWLKTYPRNQARWFTGAFAYRSTLCRLGQRKTLDFLHKEFGMSDSASD